LERRLRFQPAEKNANPQRLASRRLKKSFLVAGCAPGPKKTIFQAWEVQTAWFVGKSSRHPNDNFSDLGFPAGTPMTIFQAWEVQPAWNDKFWWCWPVSQRWR
jgi:hypothetical protein